MTENRYDTIVVGGGIAGLTSAAYLSRSGIKTLLIEKNSECGGLVSSFVRDGFHFDAGVRALEDAGIIFPMLNDLGIKLDVVKSPVSVGIESEILNIEDLGSLIKYKELLLKFFPESKVEIDRIIKVIRRIMRHMDVLYGIENPVFKDIIHDRRFLFRKLIPWLPRFIFTVGKINKMNMPVEDYLKTFVKNPSLRDIIAQHFFKKTPTFFALSYFSLYLDYFYPRGGTGKLPEALKHKITSFGGEIQTETKITLVDVENHMVKDHNGVVYYYNRLIWAADLKTLYKITDTERLPATLKIPVEKTKSKFMANRGGDSVFSLFLEVSEPLDSFRKIANGHFFYTPSGKGLGETHTSELNELLSNFTQFGKEQILEWAEKFTRLNTYEISIPGLKDPGLVPPGKTGLIISFLAEYDLFKRIRDAGWIDEFVGKLEDMVISVISSTVYPMLNGKIINRFSLTPLSIENRVGSSEGAITGWAFTKEVPVINKIQSSGMSVLTPFPSVYQAGQWVYSPAGVPMSILTGRLAADRVVKELKRKKTG